MFTIPYGIFIVRVWKGISFRFMVTFRNSLYCCIETIGYTFPDNAP